jgi:hypothetical protein
VRFRRVSKISPVFARAASSDHSANRMYTTTRKNAVLIPKNTHRIRRELVVSAAARPVTHIPMSIVIAVNSFVKSVPASSPSAARIAGVENVHVRYRPHGETTSPVPASGWPAGICNNPTVSPETRLEYEEIDTSGTSSAATQISFARDEERFRPM